MFKKKLWVFLKQTQPNYIKNIKHPFEQGEDYYKPLRVSDCYSNKYIQYESNGDKNETLTIKEYPDTIKLYFKDIINNLKNLIHGSSINYGN